MTREWKHAALYMSGTEKPNANAPIVGPKRAPRNRSGAVWTMRDGQRIRVCAMSDSHLLNTIEFVKRASERRRLAIVLSMGQYAMQHEDTMAAEAAEGECRAIADSDDPADFFPVYDDLIFDAEQRGLVVDRSAWTIYTTPRRRAATS